MIPLKKEQIFAQLFAEYSAEFCLSQICGFQFETRQGTKDLLAAIADKAESVWGFSPSEFSAWVEKQPRDTIHGIIPVPNFI